jgi:hypothetical protein
MSTQRARHLPWLSSAMWVPFYLVRRPVIYSLPYPNSRSQSLLPSASRICILTWMMIGLWSPVLRRCARSKRCTRCAPETRHSSCTGGDPDTLAHSTGGGLQAEARVDTIGRRVGRSKSRFGGQTIALWNGCCGICDLLYFRILLSQQCQWFCIRVSEPIIIVEVFSEDV